ncbi:uncharacterized protein LTR77_010639 [Saxophila tyrrhenica]|uniref:Transcription factor domain-containing protein n=1 Tax=Saxophila tyrrhenica TaxID=1690608 RepID=A0AAV9NUQ6_9PEZI|nr:hypothetical protein LTR77_010639 [Saxophila tyrrhenica]
MHSFDHGRLEADYEKPLIDIILALGAWQIRRDEILAPSTSTNVNIPPGADHVWAEGAQANIFSSFKVPTNQQLMALLLLCEYAHRTEHFSWAFGMAGCVFRHIRILGLDVPRGDSSSLSLVTPEREIEHRIVWASYSIDVLLGSGVDKHSSWGNDFPRIPLPCSNESVLSQEASQPLFLASIEELGTSSIVPVLDLPALNVVLIHLRTRVLRCIRTAQMYDTIETPTSPFVSLLAQLERFRTQLPSKWELTELNIYVHKDHRVLGGVVFLHMLYHAALCDLTRISLPGFDFPLADAVRRSPSQMVRSCQQRCCFHAEEISNIIRRIQLAGDTAFDDPFVADATMESTKIQIIYSAIISQHVNFRATRNNIMLNMDLLHRLRLDRSKPSPHVQALLPICNAFGFHDIAGEYGAESIERLVEVTGPADLDHLSNISHFRRARHEAADGQQIASAACAPSSASGTSPGTLDSRVPPEITNGARYADNEPATARNLGQPDTYTWLPHPAAAPVPEIPLHDGSNLPHTTWSASSLEPAAAEDYTRVAEEMSQYLTRTGADLSTLWDFDMMYQEP